MLRGAPKSNRKPHPPEPLGGRSECQPRYEGVGRVPVDPIIALACSEQDIGAKRSRAGRGEQVKHSDDVLDDESAGLLVGSAVNTSERKHNCRTVVTGDIDDCRDGHADGLGKAPPNWELMSLGGRIRSLRRGLSLSLRGLAAQLHVNDRAVRFWESNKFRPKTGAIVQMADLFGVHPGLLLDGLLPNGRIG
jgi:DNA-binding XRE family transcriptional regulator